VAVVASLPGPQQPLKFSGATLEQTIFRVPQPGRTGMGVSSLGHGGGKQLGLFNDEHLCLDRQAVIDRFEPGLERLVWLVCLALMLPSAGETQPGRWSEPAGGGWCAPGPLCPQPAGAQGISVSVYGPAVPPVRATRTA
jgi:hypothetical protein